MAKIEMSLEEYKVLEQARDEARAEAERLRQELVDAKMNAGDGVTTKGLTQLARSLLTCTRFAVGQLPSESVKSWPSEALLKAADLLACLPDHSVDDISIASEFRAFAAEAQRNERIRAEAPIIDKIINGELSA